MERGRKDNPTNPALVFAARHEFEWRAVDPLLVNDPQWQYADPTQVINVSSGWLADGWNVGVFHWTQLADDDDIAASWGTPIHTEAKIWTADRSGVKMRWRKCNPDNTLIFEERAAAMPTKPVKNLFYDAYKAALAQYQGSEIRMVGHSLGAQLEVATAKLLYDDAAWPANRKPKRIALVDPYWTPPQSVNTYKPEGVAAGELTRRYVRALIQAGVIFERNTTSEVNENNFGDTNRELDSLISNTKYDTDYLSGPDKIFDRHTAGFKVYFWSRAFAAPDECAQHSADRCSPTGRRAQSSVTTAERTLALMNPDGDLATEDGALWEQVAGKNTAIPEDDAFKCTNACTQNVLVSSPASAFKSPIGEVFQAWLPSDLYTVQTINSLPNAATLDDTAILVLALPKDTAVVSTLQAFVDQGRSLLIIGEHAKYLVGAASSTRPYAATFGLPFGSTALLPGCKLTNQVAIRGSMLGFPNNTVVNVAGVNTVSGGTPVLQTQNGKTVLAVLPEEGERRGRVAVAGDSNIWQGCADYATVNKPFNGVLFDWLSGRF
ncbi:MAG: hypothetical protein H7Z42_22380 [Roseiflexaceae bacterium]|nr:hypothetical protein [Roseiflexaceae bacterium]